MSAGLHRVQRTFVAFFVVGFLICGWALFSATIQARNAPREVPRIESKLLGVTFFSVSRSGRQTSIRPHLGVPLMLVAFPVLAAVVGYATAKGRARR